LSPRRALSRRTALLGAVALGTAACTPYSLDEDQRPDRATTPRPEEPRTDPDVPLAAAVLAAEQALVDRIDATVTAHPRLERVLSATRDVHAAHVDLLADAAPDGGSPSPSATPPASPSLSPSAGASSSPSAGSSATTEAAPPVPRDPGQALRVLARHEDELNLADKRSAFAAESGSFARVLASMAAAAAQQATVLRAATVPGARR
jgi:hypothetical protein